jgi:hypothetical protein
MELCAPGVYQKALMIEYTGDNGLFPSEADAIFGWLASSRKRRHRIRGNHHGQPCAAGEPNGQIEAGKRIREWLEDEGFAHA